MNRSIRISKQRPADWPATQEEAQGRHLCTWIDDDLRLVGWGVCDMELRGREMTMTWIVNGPNPVKVASKRKHRRPV